MQDALVLVLRIDNQVEVTCHNPRVCMQISDILQLLQESDLLHVVLQPIHPCEPPATTSTDRVLSDEWFENRGSISGRVTLVSAILLHDTLPVAECGQGARLVRGVA
jgi:hypothetical protein